MLLWWKLFRIKSRIWKLRFTSEMASYDPVRRLVALGSSATPSLVRWVRHQQDPIGIFAAEALGRIGSPAAVEPLIEAITDIASNTGMKTVAAQSLGLLKDKKAVPALIHVLESEQRKQTQLAATIIESLGQLGDPRAIKHIAVQIECASLGRALKKLAEVEGGFEVLVQYLLEDIPGEDTGINWVAAVRIMDVWRNNAELRAMRPLREFISKVRGLVQSKRLRFQANAQESLSYAEGLLARLAGQK
jgi:hypothetical protein